MTVSRCTPPVLPLLLLLLLLLLLAVLTAAAAPAPVLITHPEQARLTASLDTYHITYPARVWRDGAHLTHNVRQTYDVTGGPVATPSGLGRRRGRGRRRRSLRRDGTAHYRLQLTEQEDVVLELRPNRRLLAPGFVVERVTEAGRPGRLHRPRRHCLTQGRLRGRPNSLAALSTCDGLSGYINTGSHQYLVEPVKGAGVTEGGQQPHLVYRRQISGAAHHGILSNDSSACQTKERGSSRRDWSAQELTWSRHRRSEARARHRRSVSAERNVETLIVADHDVVQFYAGDNLEAYLLTVMNGVAQLYHDASIGNAINVILVRMLVLESPDNAALNLTIGWDGDSALKDFCNWQTAMNPSNESHPNHHDVAVLLTRRNICSENETCNTLGLAEVSGMCQPARSCNINQDTGLSVSFTIAHELGHNFGMNHDGPGNGCDQPDGLHKHVMSPNLVNDVTPVVWSSCSRREITKFLDRDWGHCLDDQPTDPGFRYPQEPPGMLYDADHQCKLLYGPAASHCDMGNICETLWCSVDGRCVTKLEPAAEGTRCTSADSEDTDTVTWCSAGECVEMRSQPGAVDGGWGGWGGWGACSRSCGTGVQSSTRHCDQPVPAYGGKYCVGERRRYRTCADQPCDERAVSFRAQQCSEFDSVPYEGRNYTWSPVFDQTLPCQLTCQPTGHHFTVVLSDTVVDGTPCHLDTDICINGRCQSIGCDGVLGSDARADRCGVCHGNGSLCHTVRDTFRAEQGDGYLVVAELPVGARSIRMEELPGTEQASFLAVSSISSGSGTDADADTAIDIDTDTNNSSNHDTGIEPDAGLSTSTEYHMDELNANRFIQWSGEYRAGGSVLYYVREELETILIPGPLKAPLLLKVLLQGSGTHVRYEYTVPGHEGAEASQVFSWRYQQWSECSVSCGGGLQTSSAVCIEDEAGRVEDTYCTGDRPETKSRPCNADDCPARWWTEPWQPCTAACGQTGNRSRSVVCVRESGSSETLALSDSHCAAEQRPPRHEPCERTAADCRAQWHTGPWREACGADPCQRRSRRVWCAVPDGCDAGRRPAASHYCSARRCRTGSAHWRRSHRHHQHQHQHQHQRRRRPQAAARDTARLTLLERRPAAGGRTGAPATLAAHRGRKAARLLALLQRTPHGAPTAAAAGSSNYSWRLGRWRECDSLCGEGLKNRSVQCIDLLRNTSVELSRCSLPVPDMYAPCTQPCLEWRVADWSPCSVLCGPGRVTRQVSCPLPSRCDLKQRPADTAPCWEMPCQQWQIGAWQPCSRPCGGGLSRRSVVCTDLETGLSTTGCGVPPPTRRVCNWAACTGADIAALSAAGFP